MAQTTLQQATTYYAQLLAYQYRGLPRASAFMQLLAKQALADLFIFDVQSAYDVATAVGVQLDVIGRYVGVSRNIGEPIDKPFFGLWDSTATDPVLQNTNGLADSTNPAVNAQAIYYQADFVGQSNVSLSDSAYRQVIQLKIILNTNPSTLAAIQDYLQEYLPGLVEIQDNQDMSLTYTLSKSTPLDPAVLEQFLPKPAGVAINFLYLTATPSTTSLTQTFHVTAPATVTTSAITVTVANGTSPYTYSWVRLSDTNPDFPDTPGTYANTPTAASTTFTRHFGHTGYPYTAVSTFICNVTDAKGVVATTGTITVTLTVDGPP